MAAAAAGCHPQPSKLLSIKLTAQESFKKSKKLCSKPKEHF
jgi:hypothetical protein